MNKQVQINQQVYVVTTRIHAPIGATYELGTVVEITAVGSIIVKIPGKETLGFLADGRCYTGNQSCHVETDLLAVERALLVESSTQEALVALRAIKSICDPGLYVSREGLDLWLDSTQRLLDKARAAVSQIP